ncbi:MAG: hypothetical protein KJ970_05740 [Candidatus Eisenbacteria bacterium]|uniref:TonB C-terminal domain-containing protein n=1 Tax=Eiseniibacteriota bacterium TaxID=2212470 RepID=A0A948RTT0_UNCEI|nr:hypothetical protein [Candidatus Eisenbacteria bacterium]MBU1949338.1 hypothetical protein [Candidatus Eisenbacteria bacterium]MBU2690411.1 hypothetical protein [Candidatus Eisenbacteria bacterium]
MNISHQATLMTRPGGPGPQTPILGQHRSRRGVWIFAFILTLMLHFGVLLAAQFLHLVEPALAQKEAPEPIQVVFAPEPDPQPPTPEEPTFFTELPPDRADDPPERADYLSNVTSRTRDDLPGGEAGALPRQEGYSDAPQIRMDQGTAQGMTAETERPEDATAPEAVKPEEKPEDKGAEPEVTAENIESPEIKETPEPSETGSSFLIPKGAGLEHPMKSFLEQGLASDSAQRRIQPLGMSDIAQEAMSSPGGNTDLSGIISLNTTEWAYGYWMQQFRRKVIQKWIAPLGYHLGLIHGYTDCELEIALTGELLRCDVIAADGHQALREASVDALRKAAPYDPLPSHFPEKTLILQIRMSYKALPPETQRQETGRPRSRR